MTFANPQMLWGLLAVLIPIVIHLFNFHRYRKVYFSNVALLSQLQTESRRQSRVQSWLVLAMRVLAVAFLVLAFADPRIGGGDNAASNPNSAVSIYIDNSYSMGSDSDDQLDDARRKALEVAEAYGIGQRFLLLTADLWQSQWLGRDELREAVEAVRLTPAAPTMSEVIERQLDLLHQSGATHRHAYVISDFQRSTADLDALPTDSTTLITLVPLDATTTDNLFIDTIRLDAPAYFAGGSVDIEATVANSGSHDAEKVPVRLTVNGRERAIATIDVAAGSSAKTILRFILDSSGWFDGCVTVDDHPIVFDNDYHFCLSTGAPVKVLSVEGRDASPCIARLFGADSTVGFHQVAADRFQAGSTLSDLIVLNGSVPLASGEAAQIASWVTDGGSLLVIPPAEADVRQLNCILGALGAPQLGQWLQRTTRANSLDTDHRLFRNVFTSHNDDTEMPVVQGHYSLAPSASRQPVIALADGGELLVHTTAGQGHIYLFTTPLDGRWTDFASQALFVPTVYNMALYSRLLPRASHTLGDDVAVELTGHYDYPPQLSGPDSASLTADIRTLGNRQIMMLHGDIAKAGIYRLADEHLALNYPRRESHMSFYTRAEVAEAVSDLDGYMTAGSPARSLTAEIAERDKGTALWRLCIVLALAALAVETAALAFNRRREKNQKS